MATHPEKSAPPSQQRMPPFAHVRLLVVIAATVLLCIFMTGAEVAWPRG